MNRKVKDVQIVKSQDGYYIGHILKDGTLSKDCRKVDDGEILALFEDFLTRYCMKNVTNYMEVQRDGVTAFEAKLFVRR